MQTPPTHERLVAQLVADARPVRPLWSPHTRLALWLALQTLTLGVAVELGLRQDLGDHLRQPFFLLQVGALVVAGAMAAAVALRGAVPGMGSGRLTVTVLLLLGLHPRLHRDSVDRALRGRAPRCPTRCPGHGGVRGRRGLPVRSRGGAHRLPHRRGAPFADLARDAGCVGRGALGGRRREVARSMAAGVSAAPTLIPHRPRVQRARSLRGSAIARILNPP